MNRQDLVRQIHIFLDAATKYDALLVNAGTGSGKTVSAWDLTTRVCGYRALMLSPKHDNIEDTFKHSKRKVYNNFIHLQGRDRPNMCQKAEVVDLSRVISVSAICEQCEFKNTCAYLQTRQSVLRSRMPVMGVHAHGSLMNEFSKITPFDVCIIDENPISSMLRNGSYQNAKPTLLRNFLNNFSSPLVPVLDEMFKDPIDYPALGLALNSVEQKDFSEFEKRVIENHFNGSPTPPLAAIVKELEYCKATAGPLDARIYWTENWDDSKKYLKLKSFDNSIFDINAPIIILDATGNQNFYQKISGKQVTQIVTQTYTATSNIKQVNSGKYALSSLVNNNRNLTNCGKNHIIFINDLVNSFKHRKRNIVTIVATKRFETLASKYIKNVNWVNFYSQRGSNNVMNVSDILIVAMSPNIPPSEKKSDAAITPVTEEEWDEVLVKEEIKQAVGRLRIDMDYTESGEKRDDRVVYVLTNVETGYKTFTKYQIEQAAKGNPNAPEDERTAIYADLIRKVVNRSMTKREALKLVGRASGQFEKSLRYLQLIGEMTCRGNIIFPSVKP